MTLVVLLAACFGLAIVAALRVRALRSRASESDDIRREFDDETKKAASYR